MNKLEARREYNRVKSLEKQKLLDAVSYVNMEFTFPNGVVYYSVEGDKLPVGYHKDGVLGVVCVVKGN